MDIENRTWEIIVYVCIGLFFIVGLPVLARMLVSGYTGGLLDTLFFLIGVLAIAKALKLRKKDRGEDVKETQEDKFKRIGSKFF